MGRLLDFVSAKFIKLLEVIMVLMMTGMLILVGLNVFLRIGVNSGVDFAEEVPRFMFIWLTFCGAVVAMKENAHIKVNMFTQMAGDGIRKIFYGITQILIFVSGCYITYGTVMLHDIIRQNASPVLQISTLWVYGVTYIAGPALTIIAFSNVVRLALGRVTVGELSGSQGESPDTSPVKARDESEISEVSPRDKEGDREGDSL
jgi:TRAP-type C4-dicarboxylate transport system permease small subunit